MAPTDNGMIEERVERLETEVHTLGSKIDGLTVRVDRLETKVDNLVARTGRVEVQLEDLRDTVSKFTDTMGARFDALDRRLEEDRKQSAANFRDIKLVLTKHHKRISALERRPRRRT